MRVDTFVPCGGLLVKAGTATTDSTALTSMDASRGFVLENLSTSVAILVRDINAASDSDWLTISPEKERFFPLTDPAGLNIKTAASTAAYQVGACV